ncbi:MAG: hypothetical protein ABGX24_02455 [Aquificota bacterium]
MEKEKIVQLGIASLVGLFAGLLLDRFLLKGFSENLIINTIYFFTLLALLWQVWEIRKQRKVDIERRNRETTVNVLSTWLRTFERKAILARHILSIIDEDQIRNVYEFKEVKLPKDEKKKNKVLNLLYALLVKKERIEEIQKSDKIPAYISAYLRSLMTEYLNTLEIILLAWDQNIIDENTFKKEFSYLIQDNKCILDKILSIWVAENYPIITKFCIKLIQEKVPTSEPSKPPLK